MVAIFDYDPRESSPNADIEVRLARALYLSFCSETKCCRIDYLPHFIHQAELTFSAGDIIHVFGDMDEDGFFYVSVG